RAYRDLQSVGNLSVGELLEISEDNDDSIVLGEFRQRALQIVAHQLVEKLLLRIVEPQQERLMQPLEDRKRMLVVAFALDQRFDVRPRHGSSPLADERVVEDSKHPPPKRARLH